jgi:hypothetical protein
VIEDSKWAGKPARFFSTSIPGDRELKQQLNFHEQVTELFSVYGDVFSFGSFLQFLVQTI